MLLLLALSYDDAVIVCVRSIYHFHSQDTTFV